MLTLSTFIGILNELTYITHKMNILGLFNNARNYELLLEGLSNPAKKVIKEFAESDAASALNEGIMEDGEEGLFLYNNIQSDIVREFRYLTIAELLDAVEASDSYGAQAPVNYTSISQILCDPQIGFFKTQQLLTPPHIVERKDISTGLLQYVGVGLRHRTIFICMLAFCSGIDLESEAFQSQLVLCQVSSSIDAEGEENTLLSGALVLADNASRKAYAGEKNIFKLASLGVEYELDALVAAAFTGVMQGNEAFGICATMLDINREDTTILSAAKSFFGKAKKYMTTKVAFTSALDWIETNWVEVETQFLSSATDGNVARKAGEFATLLFTSWHKDTNPFEPMKAAKSKKKESGLFKKRV